MTLCISLNYDSLLIYFIEHIMDVLAIWNNEKRKLFKSEAIENVDFMKIVYNMDEGQCVL